MVFTYADVGLCTLVQSLYRNFRVTLFFQKPIGVQCGEQMYVVLYKTMTYCKINLNTILKFFLRRYTMAPVMSSHKECPFYAELVLVEL